MGTRTSGLRGSANVNAKLTEDQVRSIFYDRRSYSLIGREFGVSKSTVSVIKNRKQTGGWNSISMRTKPTLEDMLALERGNDLAEIR